MYEMKPSVALFAFILCFLSVQSCCNDDGSLQDIYLERAKSTMEAVYSCYSVDTTCLLVENYPVDDKYKPGYLASEAQSAGARYSYLWPFSGTLSATVAIMHSDPSYADTLVSRVLPGLHRYYDNSRLPEAYSSYIDAGSDRYYDDNVWLGIDFTDLYLLTSDSRYLTSAEKIWSFIESGIDERLGGGIYWCEQKKESKHTCSNAPGAVLALKLYKATGDEKYLFWGKNLYEWTKNTLLDPTDSLYFDNINLSGDIQTWKFSYNSGQMVQAGVLLYTVTGEESYLSDAKSTAASCYSHFFEDCCTEDGESVRILKAGNTWFNAVMFRGLVELYSIDGNRAYVDAVQQSLDMAWSRSRTPEGLFSDDCSGRRHDQRKWLLVQGAMAEMYARLAAVCADDVKTTN